MYARTGRALGVGALALVLVAALVVAASMGGPRTTEARKRVPAYAPEVAEASGRYDPKVKPSDFVRTVDNEYFPLKPGTTFVYEGQTRDGLERIVVEVTRRTRTILGVKCVVVRDRVYLDGGLIEDTFDWYAQDRKGNVWYFGEDTREYENGEVVSTAGSFEAGKDGAKPGILMKANPRVGDSYRQESYKGEAEDMAEVLDLDAQGLNRTVNVPHGSFEDVLMTKEWTPLEPDILEHKYYAPGVGPIGEASVVGGSTRIRLVEIEKD